MNVLEMKSTVSSMIGDIQEAKVQSGEMIRFLNDAQDTTGNLLVNIVRQRFATKTTINLVNNQELYDLPKDFADVIRVAVDGSESAWRDLAQLGSLERNLLHEAISHRQQWFYILGGTAVPQIGIRPLVTGISSPGDKILELYYYRKPVDFSPMGWANSVVVTSDEAAALPYMQPQDNTEFEASSLDFAGSASKNGLDDFWNGSEIVWLTGNNTGIRSRVIDFKANEDRDPPNATDYWYGSFTLAEALPNKVLKDDTFRIAQMSLIPAEYHHLVCLYAAWMSAPKAEKDPAQFFQAWQTQLGAIVGKYTQNVAPPLPGDSNLRTGQ